MLCCIRAWPAKLSGTRSRVILEVDPAQRISSCGHSPDSKIVPFGRILLPDASVARLVARCPATLLKSWDDFRKRERISHLKHGASLALRERSRSDGRRVIGLSWINRAEKIGSYKSAGSGDFEVLLFARLPVCRFAIWRYGQRNERSSAGLACGSNTSTTSTE